MADEEFNCKPTDENGNLIGIGILMDGFKTALLAMVKPYETVLGIVTDVPGKLTPLLADVDELAITVASVMPPAAMAVAAAELPAKLEGLPKMPEIPLLGSLGGLDVPEPKLLSIDPPYVPTGVALAKVVLGLVEFPIPLMAALVGVDVEGKTLDPTLISLPNFDLTDENNDITLAIGKIPGLDKKSADQLAHCVKAVLEPAMKPLGV